MCTATWLRDGSTFRLFFNRDESRRRPVALPPAVHLGEGGRYLAPTDSAKGGTWIAAGERGTVLALLNRSGGTRPLHPGTRGRLIPRWIAAADSFDLVRCIANEDLTDLPPFRLLAFGFDDSAEGRAVIYGWDGRQRERSALESARGLVASSGLGDAAALASRGAVFQRIASTADAHRAFHRSHEPERGPYSPCMHHDLARTVSHTELEIGAEGIVMRYFEGSPCQAGLAAEVRL